jgi:uncharacterized membrane protein YhaH (DUF805 family)
MQETFDLKTFLLSPEGRVGRSPFFSFIAITGMYSAILGFTNGFIGRSSVLFTASVIVLLAVIWPVWCVTAKRLHDIGQPAPWALLMFVPEILLIAIIAIGLPSLSGVQIAATIIRCLFVFALIVMPGTKTENRYGAVPAQ